MSYSHSDSASPGECEDSLWQASHNQLIIFNLRSFYVRMHSRLLQVSYPISLSRAQSTKGQLGRVHFLLESTACLNLALSALSFEVKAAFVSSTDLCGYFLPIAAESAVVGYCDLKRSKISKYFLLTDSKLTFPTGWSSIINWVDSVNWPP